MYASGLQWLTALSLYLLIGVSIEANLLGKKPRGEGGVSKRDRLRNAIYTPLRKTLSAHKPDDRLKADSSIRPFDEELDLPLLPAGKHFKPIGHVKPLSAKLAKPSMFSACFTISSRDKQDPELCLEGINFSIPSMLKKLGPHRASKYQFDTNQLHPSVSAFNPNRRTIVVIPGYLTGAHVEWQQEIADSWLELEDVNVILVTWPAGNHRLVYEDAAENVPILARQVTILLYYLATVNGRDFKSRQFRSSIHLVGHSLGAHAAGFVGKELGGQVDRITALDPAGPIFDSLPEQERLSKSDAKFVYVLHTNAGKMKYIRAGLAAFKLMFADVWEAIRRKKDCTDPNNCYLKNYEDAKLSQALRLAESKNSAWFGYEQPLGHMDYYANGGSIQPGCKDEFHICDHSRSTALYIAVLKREIVARKLFREDSSVIREKRHRLFAFRPREYRVFQSGGQVHQECAKFLLADSSGNIEERRETHKRCTVPIDFVSTGTDLQRELTEDYGVDLNDADPERRYYFETLDQSPYVSDQLLMRIHTVATPANAGTWSNRCRLAALVLPPGGEIALAQAEQQPHNSRPIDQDDFYGHIVPIASTNDWTDKFLTPNMLQSITSESITSSELRERLLPYLPPHLAIKLGYDDQKSGLVKWVGDHEEEAKCMLTIAAVELRSLAGAYASTDLTLWYADRKVGPITTTVEGKENPLLDYGRLEKPLTISNLDSAQYFFLSSIGFGDQPSA